MQRFYLIVPIQVGSNFRKGHLTMYDLGVGKHKIDIRFWREGEQTAFEVIKGDTKLVERCHMASKLAQLRTGPAMSASNMQCA